MPAAQAKSGSILKYAPNRTVRPRIRRLMLRRTLAQFIFGAVNEKLLSCLAAQKICASSRQDS
jgi:hypothetical protein